jgi:very-short-patch-repair endonuclease
MTDQKMSRPGADALERNRDRVLRLLRFLTEYVQLKIGTPVLDLRRYEAEGLVLWFHALPAGKGLFSVPQAGDDRNDNVWLRAQKQQLSPSPRPPELVRPWVEAVALATSSGNEPILNTKARLPVKATDVLLESRDRDAADPSEHRLGDHPEVLQAWDEYLPKWRDWAQEDARQSAIQEVYSALYGAYQKQKRFGDAYEVLIGLGLLTLRDAHGRLIRRHLVGSHAELHFDEKAGVMEVQCPPPPDGAHPWIETEFLPTGAEPLLQHRTSCEEQLREIGDEVWDRTRIDAILRALANSLNLRPGPSFDPSLEPPSPGMLDGDTVTFAPAVILRRRTVRGTLALIKQLEQRIGDGESVPFGLARLVDYLDDATPTADGLIERPSASVLEEILFPLKASEEQRQIAERLERGRGVLVQGPPGTGKSHTIANLICHLLATGNRILVTSETVRALTVLQEMIMEQVPKFGPLCISLLGTDKASIDRINASLQGIKQEQDKWNGQRVAEKLAQGTKRLEDLRGERAGAQRTLRELREAECKPVTIGDGTYRGTAASIARRVEAERSALGWLAVLPECDPQPPMTNNGAAETLGLLREFKGASPGEAALKLPPLSALASADTFAELCEHEKLAKRDAEERIAGQHRAIVETLAAASEEALQAVAAELATFLRGREYLGLRQAPWLEQALIEVLSGRDAPWKARAETTRSLLAEVRQMLATADRADIRLPEACDESTILADAAAMLAHLRSGGHWSVLGFRPAATRSRWYLRKRVLVDGERPVTVELLETLATWLKVQRTLREAAAQWPEQNGGNAAPATHRAAELEGSLHALDQLLSLREVATRVDALIEQGELGCPPIRWGGLAPAEFQRSLEAAQALQKSRKATASVEAAAEALRPLHGRPHTHAVVASLLGAVETRDLQAWSEARALAGILWFKKGRFERLQELARPLASRAPIFWQLLLETAPDPAWDSRLATFEAAWRWAHASNWLATWRDRAKPSALEATIRGLNSEELETIQALGATKAWSHFFQRLRPELEAKLNAWSFFTEKGKRSGQSAARYRAAARESMKACVEAVPAWIVPRYLLAEFLSVSPELFDTVIVDEASQSGIDSLFLFALGKRTIVVGDPKQCSPSDDFMPEEAVAALRAKYLHDIPFADLFAPKVSMYTHAHVRFGMAQTLTLREHFRCVPEIIAFSDQLCYAPSGTPLIPLRSYEPHRLEPLVRRFVRDGFQEGKAGSAINRPEAHEIVSTLVACCRDPRYQGKSFGVISLLGTAQAGLIERLLLSQLGPQEMEDRRLVCGDADAFQGDERDVIFLSLVSAPPGKIGALSGERYEQRFNVAASRARDQMWLFHSASLDDLGATGMRPRLLEFFLQPPGLAPEEEEPKFDSDFERDVHAMLTARGYRVRTQVPGGDQLSHRYRIDLVVEGRRSRLAIECDGDEYHRLEHYEKDMERQRQLERAGWIFARILASDFYRDREAAMQQVWRELERLRILPWNKGVVRSEASAAGSASPEQPPEDLQAVSSSARRQNPVDPPTATARVARRQGGAPTAQVQPPEDLQRQSHVVKPTTASRSGVSAPATRGEHNQVPDRLKAAFDFATAITLERLNPPARRVYAWLHANSGWHSPAAITTACRIGETDWRKVRDELMDARLVEATGQRRTATYRLATRIATTVDPPDAAFLNAHPPAPQPRPRLPGGDQECLRYFASVPSTEWGLLAAWAATRDDWKGHARFIEKVATLLAMGKAVPETDQIFAARRHQLARRVGFRPEGLKGQADLRFD